MRRMGLGNRSARMGQCSSDDARAFGAACVSRRFAAGAPRRVFGLGGLGAVFRLSFGGHRQGGIEVDQFPEAEAEALGHFDQRGKTNLKFPAGFDMLVVLVG